MSRGQTFVKLPADKRHLSLGQKIRHETLNALIFSLIISDNCQVYEEASPIYPDIFKCLLKPLKG